MKASDVIRIGRSRNRAASTAADQRRALILQLLGELDDQDRVLGGQPDQHHETHLGEDIVVLPAQHDPDDRRDQAHRHDQDDGERQGSDFHTAPPAPERRTPPPARTRSRGVAARFC